MTIESSGIAPALMTAYRDDIADGYSEEAAIEGVE